MATSAPIQIPLPSIEALDPLPVTIGHYVAVLQSKSGEREALSHVSPAAWERLTPLVEVVGPKNPPAVLSKNQVADWVRRLWKAIDGHPFYLDTLRLKATHPVHGKTGTDPVLARIYDEARKRRMRFVPVVHVGQSPAAHVRLVADAALQDGHGA